MQNKYNIQFLHEDPMVYQIDNFLSESECDAILGETPPMERSTGGLERSVSSYRTSSTAWLNPETITNNTARKIIDKIEQRIAELVGLPLENQVRAPSSLSFDGEGALPGAAVRGRAILQGAQRLHP